MAIPILTEEQQHDDCWKAVRRACKAGDYPDLMHTFEWYIPVFLYGTRHIITFHVIYTHQPLFRACVDVYNNYTSKRRDYEGTDEPLILYGNMREGLKEQLKSIAWKADEPRRRAMLDFLSATAIGDIQQE